MFYQWSRGVQIRANLDLIMDWAHGVELGELALGCLSKLSTAVNLLATPKEHLLQVYNVHSLTVPSLLSIPLLLESLFFYYPSSLVALCLHPMLGFNQFLDVDKVKVLLCTPLASLFALSIVHPWVPLSVHLPHIFPRTSSTFHAVSNPALHSELIEEVNVHYSYFLYALRIQNRKDYLKMLSKRSTLRIRNYN